MGDFAGHPFRGNQYTVAGYGSSWGKKFKVLDPLGNVVTKNIGHEGDAWSIARAFHERVAKGGKEIEDQPWADVKAADERRAAVRKVLRELVPGETTADYERKSKELLPGGGPERQQAIRELGEKVKDSNPDTLTDEELWVAAHPSNKPSDAIRAAFDKRTKEPEYGKRPSTYRPWAPAREVVRRTKLGHQIQKAIRAGKTKLPDDPFEGFRENK